MSYISRVIKSVDVRQYMYLSRETRTFTQDFLGDIGLINVHLNQTCWVQDLKDESGHSECGRLSQVRLVHQISDFKRSLAVIPQLDRSAELLWDYF